MTADLDSIQVVIPVRNEEATIAAVVEGLRARGLRRIRVVDNGSADRSGSRARQAGAEVLEEPRAGYGRACWRGLADLDPAIAWILFCDGDGSDDLEALPSFLDRRDRFDLLLGDRTATAAGRSVLTPAQRLGNRLATVLIRLGWGHRYADLGPFRLIRRAALESLAMADRGYGWTIEMQVKALQAGLRVVELPVTYRRRQGGRSKISGRIGASLRAGWVILSTLALLRLRR
jgi:glycosyltransferase involved in cell wall biosynthesis